MKTVSCGRSDNGDGAKRFEQEKQPSPSLFVFSLLSRPRRFPVMCMNAWNRLVKCYPPRPPSASANNTFLDLHNCSTIAKYLTASSLAFFPTSASYPPAARLAFSGTTRLRLSYLLNGIMAGD